MKKTIHLFKPEISVEAQENALRVMRSHWTTLGPETEKFEEEFANLVGTKYCVATNNCTTALEMAIAALDLHDEYAVTTAMTFISTPHAIKKNGLRLIYADVNPHDGSMDMDDLETICKKYHPRLVVPVHYMGNPVDMNRLIQLSVKYNFNIIEDCAHGPVSYYTDANWRIRHIGSESLAGCFSFHTLKPMSCGDGGAITTDYVRLYEKLRDMRWFNASSTHDREKAGRYSWDYNIWDAGFKGYMNDITAGIARGQLLHIRNERFVRHQQHTRYCEGLSERDFLRPLSQAFESAFHLCVCKFMLDDDQEDPNYENDIRADFIKFLGSKGVHVGVHYKPTNSYNYVRGDIPRTLPVTQKLYEEIVSLPIHHNHSMEDINYIIDLINEGAWL